MPISYAAPSGGKVPIRFSVPEGRHTARLWIESPFVNHFIRVRTRELKDADLSESEAGADLPSVSTRTYFVATPEKPVRLAVEGPTSLQIDELREGRTMTRWQRVSSGWQEIVLAPEEGWLRTGSFACSSASRAMDARRSLRRRRGRRRRRRLSPSAKGGPVEPGTLVLDDTYSLGGQEDGTISLQALLIRRRAFDEQSGPGGDAESFLEFDVGHHYFSEPWNVYFDTIALARAHFKSGPLIGAEEDAHVQPDWLPCVLRVMGSIYAQWPEGSALVPEGPLEWSAYLRGGLCALAGGKRRPPTPSLAIFGRYLSPPRFGPVRPGEPRPGHLHPRTSRTTRRGSSRRRPWATGHGSTPSGGAGRPSPRTRI